MVHGPWRPDAEADDRKLSRLRKAMEEDRRRARSPGPKDGQGRKISTGRVVI